MAFLLRWLTDYDFLRADPRRVTWFAFAGTAVLFAIEHHLWFAGLVAGIAFNLLYMWTRKYLGTHRRPRSSRTPA